MATSAKQTSIELQGQSEHPARRWPAWVHQLKHLLGLDRAIAYTVLARGVQILGSTGTVLLILHFLTPVEQGYYYTLLSLVSLQTVFELGFSFVILQMAAHESAHLVLHPDGRIEGDPAAHARLASVLQKTFKWYLVASVVLCASLLPVGIYFFSRHAQAGPAVEWRGPWVTAAIATSFMFLLNPYYSFLEGCGQVWQVGRMRFRQALLGAFLGWAALALHHGLYSPAMVIIAYVLVGSSFLWTWKKPLGRLLRDTSRNGGISWMKEVWPFQWRIGVSSACAYFTLQVLTPVLFAYRGPAEAGQFAMSLSITTYLTTLMLAWMSTKATPFGRMIARGEYRQVKAVFFRTLRKACLLLICMSVACELAVIGVRTFLPELGARIASPQIFGLLLVTCISWFIVQSMAVYLRSFKREPFLVQSMVVAALTVVAATAVARNWGIAGVAATYTLSTGVIGLSIAVLIFRSWQHQPANSEDGGPTVVISAP